MGDQRYQDIKRIFLSVVELPTEQRGDALAAACGGDPELRAAVERLLSEDAGVQTRSTLVAGAGLSPTGGPEEPARIGTYRILSRLGEGGFGVVYLAEQTEPVRRRVALKVIKPGMDSARVISRFEAERQALAMMDHPNIAKVLDAGTTPADQGSRPYFAMEHVAGEPLTDYCDRHNLAVPERLRLFEQVCGAIQHAHAKGIIHRDIKPSNVLVSVREGESPVPKVIDFGVAKALHRSLTEHTIFTEQGQVIGTPEYMSPEQAEMGALDIDTRSDVYSLGVLLYELLVGARPFDLRKVAVREIARVIRESDPPRPSTRLSSLGASGTAIAARRRTSTQALSRALSAELEWIPLKAMRKDRTERYQSAADLARDVERYLAGQPLVAGPESAMYRARKFVRRHRVGVAVTLAVALVTLGAGAVSILSLRRALAAEARRAAAESARAADAIALRDVEAARAAEAERALAAERSARLAAEFVAQIFGATRQWGRDVPFRDVLVALSDRLTRDEASEPAVVARARISLGHSFRAVAEPDAARVEFERAAELARGADDPEALADALAGLSGVHFDAGRLPAALEMADGAIAARLRLAAPAPEDVAHDQALRGQLLRALHRLPEAEDAYGAAIAAEEAVDPPRADAAATLVGLARVRADRGDVEHALALADQAERALQAAAGVRDEWLHGYVAYEHGVLLRNEGRPEQAIPKLQASVASFTSALGPAHPETSRARAALNQARAMLVPHAVSATEEQRAAARSLLDGQPEADRVGEYHATAIELFGAGEFEMAIQLIGRASEAAALIGAEDPRAGGIEAARALTSKSGMLLSRGMVRAAQTAAGEALAAFEAAGAMDHRTAPRAMVNGALASLGLDEFDRAEELSRRALAHPQLNGPDPGEARRVLGLCLLAHGQAEQAEDVLDQARDLLAALPAIHAWRVWRADAALARCALALSRTDEALARWREAGERAAVSQGRPADARQVLFDLADVLEQHGAADEAAQWRSRAEQIR